MGDFVILILLVSVAFGLNVSAKQFVTKELGDNITGICDEIIILNEPGFIMSPGFPTMYPENLYCTWKVIAPEDQVIDIQFGAMDIEYEESCIYDSLVIQGQKYCGRTEPEDFVTETNAFEITFLSDERVSAPGFDLYYHFVACHSSGYVYNHDLKMCYRYVATPITWDEARVDCQTVPGADLIQVTNKDIHDFVSSTTSGNTFATWLGARLYHQSDVKEFVWLKTNTLVSDYDTYWEEGQPDVTGQDACMFMHYDGTNWYDHVCNSGTGYYICEHQLSKHT